MLIPSQRSHNFLLMAWLVGVVLFFVHTVHHRQSTTSATPNHPRNPATSSFRTSPPPVHATHDSIISARLHPPSHSPVKTYPPGPPSRAIFSALRPPAASWYPQAQTNGNGVDNQLMVEWDLPSDEGEEEVEEASDMPSHVFYDRTPRLVKWLNWLEAANTEAFPNCSIEIVGCGLYNSSCLALTRNGTSHVSKYLHEIHRGLRPDNQIGAFVSSVMLFVMARLGGIPVPEDFTTKMAWGLVFVLQIFEIFVISCSLLMNISAFFAVHKNYHRCARIGNSSIAPVDASALVTLLLIPPLVQSMTIIFIYSYVVATFLRVRTAANIVSSQGKPFKIVLMDTPSAWVRLPQMITLAIFGAIAYSTVSCVVTLSVVGAGIFSPISLLSWLFVEMTYKSAALAPESLLPFIGWLKDIRALTGFNPFQTAQYPRLLFQLRSDELGEVNKHPGFFYTLAYGFNVCFLAICMMPMLCYGTWIAIPYFMGVRTLQQTLVVVLHIYLRAPLEIYAHGFQWDWPEWLNIQALLEFLNDPTAMVNACLSSMVTYLDYLLFGIDLEIRWLLDGALLLLRLNSVVAILKSIAASLIKVWLVFFTPAASQGRIRMVQFGDCVPQGDDLEALNLLKKTCAGKELAKLGFEAATLKSFGFRAKQLIDGFPLKDLTELYTLKIMCKEGFTIEEYSKGLIRSGFPGFSFVDFAKAGFEWGDLKEAGMTAKEGKEAGMTAKQGKDAGFTWGDLKKAGMTAKECKDAGFTWGDLKEAGMTAKECKEAGMTAKQGKAAGFTWDDLKEAGMTAKECKEAGMTAKQGEAAGFTWGDLKKAGMTAKECKEAGMTAKQGKAAGFPHSKSYVTKFFPRRAHRGAAA